MRSVVRVVSGLAIVAGLVSACSSPPPRDVAQAPAPVLAPAVEARILPPFHGLIVFDVNQPAYVAVFDVRPYIGIEMIYPGPNDPGQATGGVQTVPIYHLVQATEERQAQATPFVGGGEDYLYLVASRTPLHLGEFADHPIALSDSAGVSLRAQPPYEQIDSLMRNVVQPRYDRDWDADVLILTPGRDGSVGSSQLAINCGVVGAPDAKICAHQSHLIANPGVVAPTSQGQPGAGATGDWRAEAERASDKAWAAAMRTGDNKTGTEDAQKSRSATPATARPSASTSSASVASVAGQGAVVAGGKP
jgi:hypothetical protein